MYSSHCQNNMTGCTSRIVHNTRRTNLFHSHMRHTGLFAVAIGSIVAMSLTSTPVAVHAQEFDTMKSYPTTPDFTRFRILLPLIFFILTFPILCCTLVLLWKRRKYYPIAGRGSTLLLLLNITFVFSSISQFVLSLIYPNGVPCGMRTIWHFGVLLAPCICYLIRAWTLAFRLEIMNHLEEKIWREEKAAILEERASSGSSVENSDAAATTGERSANNANIVSLKIAPVKEEEDDATKEMPGEWFINHRRFTEQRFFVKIVAAFYAFVFVTLGLICIFDPDVALFDNYWRHRGMLGENESLGSQFTLEGFFEGTPCQVWSIKMSWFCVLFSFAALPLLQWVIWRLVIDAKRRKKRKEEQEELRGKDSSRGRSEQKGTGLKKGTELDDSVHVKREFLAVLGIASTGMTAYFFVQVWIPEHGVLIIQFPIFLLSCVSIILPLRTSYAISRQYRAQMAYARGDTTGNAITGKKGDLYATRLPHQRQFYSLKYILRNPETYPVLLAFLQKEFSSENALFWSESRQFELACKAMESLLFPSWPNALGDEEMTSGGGTQGGGRSSLGGGKSRVGGTVLRQAAPYIPSSGGAHTHTRSVDSNGLATTASTVEMVAPLSPSAGQQNSAALSGATSPSGAGSIIQSPSGVQLPSSPAAVVFVAPLPSSPVIAIAPAVSPTAARTSVIAVPPSSAARAHPAAVVVEEEEEDFPALHAEAARLKTWARTIFTSYLARSAPYEINIPEDLFKLVASQLKQLESWDPSPPPAMMDQMTPDGSLAAVAEASPPPQPPPFALSTLYKQTHIAVYELIARDSFRRFVLTPAFAALIAAADEVELARLEKQEELANDTKNVIDKAIQAQQGTNGLPGAPSSLGWNRPIQSKVIGASSRLAAKKQSLRIQVASLYDHHHHHRHPSGQRQSPVDMDPVDDEVRPVDIDDDSAGESPPTTPKVILSRQPSTEDAPPTANSLYQIDTPLPGMIESDEPRAQSARHERSK